MPFEFFTLDQLGSLGGMVLLVGIIVRVTKQVVRSFKSDRAARLYTLAVSLLAQGFVVFVRGVFTVEAIGLAFANGVLVAAICMGGLGVIPDQKALE